MAAWFWSAVAAAVLYGAHQIFTRLASERIGDGLGGFVVEATAALTIVLYLIYLRFSGRWNQVASIPGINYGAAMMAVAGIFFFKAASPLRLLGVVLYRGIVAASSLR